MSFKVDYKLCRVSLYDKLLIGVLLLFSFISLLSFKNSAVKDGKAVVYHNGDLLEEICLRKKEVKELHLAKGRMKIETRKGSVRVLESSCPHKLCVNMGWIKNKRQAIVCVPNKVLIEIKGVDSQYDAVSY